MDGKINLQDEQEVLTNCADMMIDIYNAESYCSAFQKQSDLGIKQEQLPIAGSTFKSIFSMTSMRMVKKKKKNANDAFGKFRRRRRCIENFERWV